jgi:exopolysaccharide biosynthesis polyprenyl glycosylphosphotransferase
VNKWGIINKLRRLADFLAVMLGFSVGYFYYTSVRAGTVPYPFVSFLGVSACAGVVFVAVFQSLRLYERETSLLHVVESKRLFLGWVFGSLLVLGATFYLRFIDFSRVMLTASLLVTFVLLVLERAWFYRICILYHLNGRAIRPSVIFGAGVVGRYLYKRIYHSPGLGIHVVGFLDDNEALWGQEVKISEVNQRSPRTVLGGLEKLPSLIEKYNLKEIFIALPTATYERNLEIAQACRCEGLAVSVVPPTYGHQIHSIDVSDIGGIPILREKETRPHFLYPFLKRLFDIAVSLLMLIFLAPVMVLIAVLIKRDSPGPIIFRQKRVGLNGAEFSFLKFRSMYVEANPYGITPQVSSDPRITRFGRWLRRSSLDEIPQLFNVLFGQMSVVGPRPEMPFIVATYNAEQRQRLQVKPGITGVWQISAVRGEPIHANMEYDLFYIEHQSLILDVIIMVKTIVTAARGIGAV